MKQLNIKRTRKNAVHRRNPSGSKMIRKVFEASGGSKKTNNQKTSIEEVLDWARMSGRVVA